MIGLRYMRLLTGIKGEDFVKPLERDISSLSKWENRKLKISDKMKNAISSYYGFPIDYIDKEINDEDKEYLKTFISGNENMELRIDTIDFKETEQALRVFKERIKNPYFNNCLEFAERISTYSNKEDIIELLKAIESFLKKCS